MPAPPCRGFGLPESGLGVLINRGDGTFDSPRRFETGKGPAAIGTADFNGDGALDLVVGELQQLEVFLNDGAGSLTALAPVQMTGPVSALAAVDVDDDGHQDLAIIDGCTVAVLRGDGSGKIASRQTVTSLQPLDGHVGCDGVAIAAADLNANRLADLVVLTPLGMPDVILTTP